MVASDVSDEPEIDASVRAARAPRGPRKPSKLEEFGVLDGGLEFVGRVARMLRRQGIYTDELDMIALGQAGLVEAAERFDPAHGSEFLSFAFCRVRGAIIDGIRRNGRLSRRAYQLARSIEALGETLDLGEAGEGPDRKSEDACQELRDRLSSAVTAMSLALYAAPRALDEERIAARGPSVEDTLSELQLRKMVGELLAELPEPEQGILRRHYVEDATFEAIAGDMGLSRSWVSRIHSRGVRRLGLRFRANL